MSGSSVEAAMRTSLAIAVSLLALPACYLPMVPAGHHNGGGTAPASGGGGGGGGGYEPAPAPAPAPTAGSGGASKESSGPQIDSVTLHNDCKKTVKLFLGDKPKFGSGTSTSIGSNTTQSYTLNAGKMMWIVDDSENGVAQYVGKPGSHRIKIPASCTSFVAD